MLHAGSPDVLMEGASVLSRDLGDFPTPLPLVAAVLQRLGPIGERWPRVLEPTCGRGHFLQGLIEAPSPPREIRGIEIQASHYETARSLAHSTQRVDVDIVRGNLFDLDLRRDLAWRERGPLLVVGNPPWVTNAELGTLESTNLPRKSNVKKLRGIEARTGASNFDIAEAIWFKLLNELAGEAATIALLCKTSVARGVLQFAEQTNLPVVDASIVRLDARAWFRASVDACLLRVDLGAEGARLARVPVFADFASVRPESALGFVMGKLIADLDKYGPFAFADGQCPLTWRQGLKHDAATVMELDVEPGLGSLRNRLGESLDVEPEWIYPLLKGADLLRSPTARPTRAVIVTQRRVGDDTRGHAQAAPKLWTYLERHAAVFARRKSSIYRGQAPYAMFGLGPYSFAPYKVAVSGLGKSPRFQAVGSPGGRPAMFDDTCYFLPCRTPEQAAITVALLNDPATLALIDALIFREAKRPITKSLLARLDLGALASRVDRPALLLRAENELAQLLANAADFGENVEGGPHPATRTP